MVRLLPSYILDTGALEEWLEFQEARGWALRDMGSHLAYFDRCTPGSCRYRCEAADGRIPLDGDQLETYRAMGWTYVTDRGTLWHIFRCGDPAAPELETDPVVQGYLFERVYRRQRWIQVLSLCLALAAAAWAAWLAAGDPEPVELALTKLPVLLLLVLMLFLCLTETVGQLRDCRRKRRLLSAGVPAEHTGPWRRHCLHARLFWGMDLLLLVLAGLFPFYQILTAPQVQLDQAAEPLPYVAAARLDPALLSEERMFGMAGREQELLIPARYDVWELYSSGAKTETYLDRLLIPALAEPLYRERLNTYRERFTSARETPVEDGRFDRAALLDTGGYQVFLACRGGTVFVMETNIGTDLLDYLDDFDGILTSFS